MNSQLDFSILILLVVVFILFCCTGILFNRNRKKHQRHIEKLKIDYDNARKSKDWDAIKKTGTLYYQSLRKDGKLTTQDHLAITTDLSILRNHN